MPDTPELGSVVAVAEQAAAIGDYASAERLLREALAQQEAELGPGHPDLANTLNNLGVVCDMAGNVDEAEQCYRRAYDIAAAALAPDHPFVATSRKNLEDLHAASRSFRPLVRGAIGVCVFVIVAIVVARSWLDSERPSRDVVSAPVGPRPSRTEIAIKRSDPVAVPHRRAVAPSTAVAPVVVNARLCRALSTGARDWSCDPAGSLVDAGPLFFYSRLRSPRATTVLHRWYHGDRLQQETKLSVRANPGPGYRTYSRRDTTAGDWRVELRGADGSLLHEERFTVR